MGLPWVRLDTGFPTNPKVLALVHEREGHRAGFVYLAALAHCGLQGTDGFVAEEALVFVHGRVVDARLLVKVGLWIERPGGWMVHGWMDKQESTTETRDRSKRAQAAAQKRWAEQKRRA